MNSETLKSGILLRISGNTSRRVRKSGEEGKEIKKDFLSDTLKLGFPGSSDGKELACNAGDLDSVPGLRRSPGEGNGYPLQHFCLENPMGRGGWWAPIHGSQRVGHHWVTKHATHILKLEPNRTNVGMHLRVISTEKGVPVFILQIQKVIAND